MGRSWGIGPPMRHLDIRHIDYRYIGPSPQLPPVFPMLVQYVYVINDRIVPCSVWVTGLVKSKGPVCESPGRHPLRRGDNVNGLALPWAPIISSCQSARGKGRIERTNYVYAFVGAAFVR
jgi:hypothetical protein